MALVQRASASSFLSGGCGCGRLDPAGGGAWGGTETQTSLCLPRLVIVADSRSSQNGASGSVPSFRKEPRFTPRASPVLEELRLVTDAAIEAGAAKKEDWFSGLIKKLPGKQTVKHTRKTVTGLEDPMKELFDYVNEHTPLEEIAKSSTVHGKQVYKTREEAPCGEYLYDLEPQLEQHSTRGNGKVRRDPNILPSQWDQDLKRSTPPGSPAKVGGGLKDALSKEQMLALAGASMVGEDDRPIRIKSVLANGTREKRNVVQQVTSTLEQWAENVRK